MAIEKIKILGAVLELPALPIQPIYLKMGPNWPNWQCCLAGISKTAPRTLIFSTAMGANYSFYVKSIAICALTFFGYIISVLASVYCAPKQSLPLLKDQIVPDHHLTLDKSKHTKPFHAPSKISCVSESFKR